MMEREEKAFEAKRAELCKDNLGKFIVMDADKIIGIYETVGVAMQAGFQALRRRDFFVREITEHDEPVLVPAYVGMW